MHAKFEGTLEKLANQRAFGATVISLQLNGYTVSQDFPSFEKK